MHALKSLQPFTEPASPPLMLPSNRQDRISYYDQLANHRDTYRKRNRYYHRDIEKAYRYIIPEGSSVLEIGCGTGDLLAAMKPGRGLGIDFSAQMLDVARAKYPHLEFCQMDAEALSIEETFDYVIISGLMGDLDDIQNFFQRIRRVTRPDTRIVIDYYNQLWEPALKAAERIGLKMPLHQQNWLALDDIENLLYISGFEVVRKTYRMLMPKRIPLLAPLCNRFLAKLPGVRKLCLFTQLVAKRGDVRHDPQKLTCSVVIPCRNEAGTIEDAVNRVPKMGHHTEIVFVEGNSTDHTYAEIERIIALYPEKDIKLVRQEGKGKGDAVRKGFVTATGDILMILDGDLTVPPEDLPKFFNALVLGKGEFINGTRLVYPMEQQAMRFLNLLGNKFFSMAFTWLLDQRMRDTLCGTKVLFKRDYEKIAAGRAFFGDFDPFGDFDLLFGAAKQHMKICEVPIRYRQRVYGDTNISRFTHGLLLFRMCWVALRKLKFN